MPEAGGPGLPWAIGVVLLGLTLSPLARPPSYDSFPFSSYPMFAHGRKDAVTQSHRAVGLLADGSRVALPPRALGSDEVLQADATLRHAIRRGRPAVSKLCLAIAARVAGDAALAAVETVALVSERHDAIAYFAGDTAPLAPPKRHGRCKVVR